MSDSINKVREFHDAFSHPVSGKIGEESLKTRQLRIKLLFEELSELAEASDCKGTFADLTANFDIWDSERDGDNVNHLEELDALCDIQYVLDGKKLTSGHHKRFDEAFKEVHRSNMTKACCSASEATDTANKRNLERYMIHKSNSYFIVKDSNGKIIKSINYSPADLSKFV